MRNIILLLIDSMNNSHIKESPIELTPFLNKLKEKGVYCDTMYSQAPYTEAANMGIYCGVDVLDDGGYMFRYRDSKLTIFEAMKQKGYETYYNDFQPQCFPSSVRRGIDDIYYSVGYDLGALWSYRLSHYAKLSEKGQLNDEDFKTLRAIFDDNLREWIKFTDDVLNNDKSVNMIIGKAAGYNAAEVKAAVTKEYEQYVADPDAYILDVLKKGTSHSLFSVPAYFQNNKIENRAMMKQARKLFRPLCKRIRSMDFRRNIRNCKGIFKGPFRQLGKFLRKPSHENMKNVAKSALLSINQLYDVDLYERIDKKRYDSFKNAPSLRTHVDHYINWRKNRTSDKPHFGFMHVDDIHNPEVFFTYDTEDVSLLEREKKNAEEILDKIPRTYYGSLSHDLSLRYIDSVIEYFFDEMEKNDFAKDTVVLVCADHGFSFSGNPLRDSAVVNLFLENYNIPCVISGPGVEHKKIEGLRESKDIPATLCYLADGKVPDEFTGRSIFEDSQYDTLGIEYCGGGCPDLTRREIKMAAFDEKYFVGTLATLATPIDATNVTEVYDLEKDFGQKENMVKKVDFAEIQYLIDKINARKEKIQTSLNEGGELND